MSQKGVTVKSGAAGIHLGGLRSCMDSPVDDMSVQIAGERCNVTSMFNGFVFSKLTDDKNKACCFCITTVCAFNQLVWVLSVAARMIPHCGPHS